MENESIKPHRRKSRWDHSFDGRCCIWSTLPVISKGVHWLLGRFPKPSLSLICLDTLGDIIGCGRVIRPQCRWLGSLECREHIAHPLRGRFSVDQTEHRFTGCFWICISSLSIGQRDNSRPTLVTMSRVNSIFVGSGWPTRPCPECGMLYTGDQLPQLPSESQLQQSIHNPRGVVVQSIDGPAQGVSI